MYETQIHIVSDGLIPILYYKYIYTYKYVVYSKYIDTNFTPQNTKNTDAADQKILILYMKDNNR